MRMIIVAGVLMLALLVAIVGSVSADYPTWVAANSKSAPVSHTVPGA